MTKIFKWFRWQDILIIFISSLLWVFFSWLSYTFLPVQYSYIISIFLMSILLSFLAFLIRKFGVVLIFFIFASLFGFWINDFGVVGWQKIIVFGVAGIIFELIAGVLELEFKNIPLDLILGVVASAMSIPFTICILLSSAVAFALWEESVNLILMSALLGLLGSVLSFLMWFKLRTKKIIMRLGYIQD